MAPVNTLACQLLYWVDSVAFSEKMVNLTIGSLLVESLSKIFMRMAATSLSQAEIYNFMRQSRAIVREREMNAKPLEKLREILESFGRLLLFPYAASFLRVCISLAANALTVVRAFSEAQNTLKKTSDTTGNRDMHLVGIPMCRSMLQPRLFNP